MVDIGRFISIVNRAVAEGNLSEWSAHHLRHMAKKAGSRLTDDMIANLLSTEIRRLDHEAAFLRKLGSGDQGMA